MTEGLAFEILTQKMLWGRDRKSFHRGRFWNDGCCMLHGTKNLIVDLNRKMEIGSAALLYHREKMVGFVENTHTMTRVTSLQVMFSLVNF